VIPPIEWDLLSLCLKSAYSQCLPKEIFSFIEVNYKGTTNRAFESVEIGDNSNACDKMAANTERQKNRQKKKVSRNDAEKLPCTNFDGILFLCLVVVSYKMISRSYNPITNLLIIAPPTPIVNCFAYHIIWSNCW